MARPGCDILTIPKLKLVSSLRLFSPTSYMLVNTSPCLVSSFYILIKSQAKISKMQDLRTGAGPTPKIGETVVVSQASILHQLAPFAYAFI